MNLSTDYKKKLPVKHAKRLVFLALKHFLKIVLPAFLVPGRLHSLFVLKHAHIKNHVVIVVNRGKGGV